MTTSPPTLTAFLYDNGEEIAPILQRLVEKFRHERKKIAGFLQHDRPRKDRMRCDMRLEDLFDGEMLTISQDRGDLARGCRLDMDVMARACARCSAALSQEPAALILNKFGKNEIEGEGFRPAIALALERGVPVYIGVPRRNFEAWRAFAEGLAQEVDLAQEGAQDAWLRLFNRA